MQVALTGVTSPEPLSGTDGRALCPSFLPGAVSGGKAVIHRADGKAVLARRAVGRGEIIVFCDSYLFTGPNMGVTGSEPTPDQHRIYNLVYLIFRSLPGAQQETQVAARTVNWPAGLASDGQAIVAQPCAIR
jgi:hypothetical protein